MASKYIQKYPVPQGFPDVLHDFAREVLRDQPENIYEFGYLYFKAMEEVSILISFLKKVSLKCANNCFNYRASRLSTRRRASTSLLLRTVNPSTRTTITSSQ